MKGINLRVRRIVITAGVAIAVAALSTVSASATQAAGGGAVLYSPDLTITPDGTAGYPRAIRLEHASDSDDVILATFARSGVGPVGTMPVYRSADGGTTWSQLSEISSNTAGWDIEAPTLFEVPRNIPGLSAGDILAAGTAWKVGDYTAQKVEVFRSVDGGATWAFLSNCTATSGMPNSWGHGIWEPTFLVAEDDTLACFISDERPANSPTNDQLIGHYTSIDGGQSWSSALTEDVAFPSDPLARPGMQTFARLPDGRVVMSYEMCRDATNADHACEVYVKFSADGLDWGDQDDPGTLVRTADARELLHTPYISWQSGGGPDGTLLLSGQRVVSGPTGHKTVLDESGTVIFANTDLGEGEWFQISAPIIVNPTGGYGPGVPSCPGYSTPAVPLSDGTSFLYFAATWMGQGNQCELRVGTGELPLSAGPVVTPGGKCLDVDTNTAVNGNRAQLWTCGAASGQLWTVMADQTIRSFGKCLDVDANGTANFAPVQLWDCNGSGAQKWLAQSNGSLLNPQSGRCLDVPQGNTADGSRLQIYDCNGLWTQRWSLPG